MPIENARRVAEDLNLQHRDRINFHPLNKQSCNDLDDAYAIQEEFIKILIANNGCNIGGWKIGLTTEKMQKFAGVDTPIAGAIISSKIRQSPCSIASSAFVRLGIEMELAVRISKEVPVDMVLDANSIMNHVDQICAAFELVDDRNADYTALDAISIAADNSWNEGIVLGPALLLTDDVALIGRKGILLQNDTVVGEGFTEDAGGDPLGMVIWLAAMLNRRGRRLQAGEWIMTGSLIPTIFVQPGERYSFTIEGLQPVEIQVC